LAVIDIWSDLKAFLRIKYELFQLDICIGLEPAKEQIAAVVNVEQSFEDRLAYLDVICDLIRVRALEHRMAQPIVLVTDMELSAFGLLDVGDTRFTSDGHRALAFHFLVYYVLLGQALGLLDSLLDLGRRINVDVCGFLRKISEDKRTVGTD